MARTEMPAIIISQEELDECGRILADDIENATQWVDSVNDRLNWLTDRVCELCGIEEDEDA